MPDLSLKLDRTKINPPLNPNSTKNKKEVLVNLDAPSVLTF